MPKIKNNKLTLEQLNELILKLHDKLDLIQNSKEKSIIYFVNKFDVYNLHNISFHSNNFKYLEMAEELCSKKIRYLNNLKESVKASSKNV